VTMFDFLKRKAKGIETKVFNNKEFIKDSTAHDPKLFKDRKRELYKSGHSVRIEREGMGIYVLWAIKKTRS